MAFVVTENCIKCKYTDCVSVCPVDCFYEHEEMLIIDPEECIDCALCETECPADAIFSENALPAGQEYFVELNADLCKSGANITIQKAPLDDADFWNGKDDKLKYVA